MRRKNFKGKEDTVSLSLGAAKMTVSREMTLPLGEIRTPRGVDRIEEEKTVDSEAGARCLD